MAKYDRYQAKAISGEFGVSKKKSTDFCEVIFEVTQGEAKGTKFPWQGYFTDGTSERTIQSLKAAGCTFPNNDVTNLSGLGTKEVEIQVEQTDFGPRVAWVNEPRLGSIGDDNKLDKGGKAALAGRLKGLLAISGGGGLKAGVNKANAAALASSAKDPWDTSEPANDAQEPLAATGTDGPTVGGDGVLTEGGKPLF